MKTQTSLIRRSSKLADLGLLVGGIAMLAVLAQVRIPLPWTPVPITGQTFGVALLSLLLGRRLGFATVVSYVFVGGLGLPVFAKWGSGLSMGPTLGYLIGMMAASFVIGFLADRGWNKSFWKAWAACVCGSIAVFAFGLFGLSFFLPSKLLLTAGLLPFIPGDVIKSVLAAGIASQIARRQNLT